MWKKVFIVFIALFATVSVGYGMKQVLFATNKSGQIGELKEGDKVILGAVDGNEVTWDVGVKNNDHYVLMTTKYISKTQACNDNTENSGTYYSAGAAMMNDCKYITKATGKVNSPIYDRINQYDTALSNAIDTYALEKRVMIEQTNGNKYAFIPTVDDITTGGRLNITDRKQVVIGNDSGANSGYFIIGNVYSSGVRLLAAL